MESAAFFKGTGAVAGFFTAGVAGLATVFFACAIPDTAAARSKDVRSVLRMFSFCGIENNTIPPLNLSLLLLVLLLLFKHTLNPSSPFTLKSFT